MNKCSQNPFTLVRLIMCPSAKAAARKSFFIILVDVMLALIIMGYFFNFEAKNSQLQLHAVSNVTEFEYNSDLVAHRVYNSDLVAHRVYNSDLVAHRVYNSDLVARRVYNSDLVAHRVYFDRRSWKSHSNSTVILVSVREVYRDAIVGCEIDGIKNYKKEAIDIPTLKFIAATSPVTHRDFYLYCFNSSIHERSSVSVLYRRNTTVIQAPVRSDSVVFPPSKSVVEDEVMVCATGFGVVPFLDQWLLYQKTIGVKFIHINTNPSFVKNLDLSSTLVKFVHNGFVKMIVWKDYLNASQVFYYSQSLKYQDCVLRYQGRYKYMLVIDFDEYFIPYDTNMTILSYAKKFIVGTTGSVILPRQQYTTRFRQPLPIDGNMTKLYNTAKSTHLWEGKSLHLVQSVMYNGVHRTDGLFPGYKILNYRDSPKLSNCYLAHLTHKRT